MPTWTLARKDLRLLLRDRRAAIILLAMPFLFILVLGVSLGEGFGQKPDSRLRISIVDLDQGHDLLPRLREQMAWLAATPGHCAVPVGPAALARANRAERFRLPVLREGVAWLAQTPTAAGPGADNAHGLAALALARAAYKARFPQESWAELVRRDLSDTAGIRVETLTLDQARDLVRNSERAAVLVFGPWFSVRVNRCSFLADGINPFYRDGVNLAALDAELLEDPTQQTAASIIDQVAQVTLLRVVLPWMIGRAFEKIGEPDFIDMLAKEIPAIRFLPPGMVGGKVQTSIQKLYPKYRLTGKTWTDLTRSEAKTGSGAEATAYAGRAGLLNRGDFRYQLLVPSYTVMFAFFLVLTVGWLFVAERRQGTLKRLRAAPLSRAQILLGKMIPCFLLSLAQGFLLLAAGRVVFGMSWGPDPLWLAAVVFATSLAAMGLALLVAALARTETQVAIYGTLLVLLLAGISGCLMGDRELMPEAMQRLSLVTPHAWALVAYRQLLTAPAPNLAAVAQACGVLAGFGVGFVALAWSVLRLD